jgi:hypothetical protein
MTDLAGGHPSFQAEAAGASTVPSDHLAHCVTISSRQRDLLYDRIFMHLSGIDGVWLAVAQERFDDAQRLGREFSDELRLIVDDLGWGKRTDDEPFRLTTPPEVVRRVVERIAAMAEAENAVEEEERIAARGAEEENRLVREACKQVLADLDTASSSKGAVRGGPSRIMRLVRGRLRQVSALAATVLMLAVGSAVADTASAGESLRMQALAKDDGSDFLGVNSPRDRETSFCKQRVLRDYEAPLRSLPAAEPPPRVLPFGPAGLEVSDLPSRRHPLFSGIDPFAPGKRLAYRRTPPSLVLRNSGADELALNWKVTVMVSWAGADGEPSSLLSATTTDVASLGPGSSLLVLGEGAPEIGTVRVDIAFFDDGQNLLGSYFEYLQVVPYRVENRLRLKTRAVPAGGVLRFRLENLGTTKVQMGGYRVQRYETNGWQEVPRAETFASSREVLSPGHASECGRSRIPEGAEPGLYRLQVRTFSLRRRGGHVRPLGRYSAETFKVTDATAA